MADTVVTGPRGAEKIVSTNAYRDIDAVLMKLEPFQTPLSSWLIISKKKSKKVDSPYAKFEWYEQNFFPDYTTVSAAISLTGATLVLTASNVGNYEVFGLKDLCLIEETGEMAYVSSVTASTNAILTHIDGSTSLTALSDTTKVIRIIGKRVYDYDGRTDEKSIQEVNYYNYLNIFREFVQTAGRQLAGKYYTDGVSHKDRVEQKVQEIRLQIERYFLYGNARGYKASGNNRATWGYGLPGYITTNVETYTGSLTEPTWRGFVKTTMQKGTNRKMFMGGTDIMDDIEMFMRDYYTLTQNPKEMALFDEFGASAKTYRMFSGTVTLVWNPQLNNKASNSGFLLEEKNIMLRHMADEPGKGSRKFRIRTNTQDPDTDGMETEVLADVGLQLKQEPTHGWIYQV